jgi:RHS repeat-associated protein
LSRNSANRLKSVNSSSYTFGINSNLLNTGSLTNTFDAANRLIDTTRSGTTIEPIYNGVNDRVGQTVGLSTTNYALDVAGGLPEVIYSSEGNLYLHLPGVIMTESDTGEVRYLLGDGLGSVRQAVDDNAELVAYHEFDPYGNPVDNIDGEPYSNTGEWWENEVGLLHLRARWYAPETGTFLSRDPVESEPPYSYGHNNPIRFADPSGRCIVGYSGEVRIGHYPYGTSGICPNTEHWIFEGHAAATTIPNHIDEPALPSGLQEIVNAVISSHSLKDDGIIFGFGGNFSSLIQLPVLSFFVPPHFVEFNECRLPISGLGAGLEVVYDFKHLERGVFLYDDPVFNIGTEVSAGGVAYIGKTRGFARVDDYSVGVDAYSGYYASGTLNVSTPGLEVGGVVIEAAPLNSEKMLVPDGVFATYYGVGGGVSGGSPINVDIAVTNYTRLLREQYTFLADLESKKKDVGARKTVASYMTAELYAWQTISPGISSFISEAITELWDYANDTSN